MANTQNLNLAKPDYNVRADIGAINDNMDILDTKIGAVPLNTSLQAQITAMTSDVSAKGKTIILLSTDDSWVKIWAKLNILNLRETASIYSHSTPTDVLSNGVRNTTLIGTVCKTATSTFDFFVRYGTNNGAMACRIEGVSSESSGTYSERTVDRNYEGTTTTVATQADLFALFDTKLNTMVNYSSALLQVSIAGDIPPFFSGARLMIILTRGNTAVYATAIIQQAGAYTIASAGKSTTWSMQQIANAGNVASLVGLSATSLASAGNGTTKYYAVANNTKMFIIVIGASSTSGMWIVNTTSNGTISILKVCSDANISLLSDGNNRIKFINDVPPQTNVNPSVYAVVLRGSVTDTAAPT